jgi:hypothetical protein
MVIYLTHITITNNVTKIAIGPVDNSVCCVFNA